VTRLMKDEGYGQGYQYPPERAGSFVPGETYLPDELSGARFYEPTNQGLEKAIGERLRRLRGSDANESDELVPEPEPAIKPSQRE
jgi:putative ATPase